MIRCRMLVVCLMLQVQSELAVCAPAIVQVLLQRLATLRPASEVRYVLPCALS